LFGIGDGWVKHSGPKHESPLVHCACTKSKPVLCTLKSPIPNNAHLATSWTPCYGQCFTWTATYDLESGFDFAKVNGISLTGAGAWTASACGTIPVSVTTDFSVLSNGLRLRASCSP
ncbi:MAG TPA: hypothetical protein VK607_03785, partial [Kofleriaceae bacterium]|nr:hypothetical protein [Kofleriaceae bacterium]